MKAPAEPGLIRLSSVAVNMVIERYVRWLIVKEYKQYFGQLPNSHIDALMQLSPSSMPVARAINTAPLISRSGTVIDGAGLDRKTGLFHRIDPLLRACLPDRAPTEEDVRRLGLPAARVASRRRIGRRRQVPGDHAGDDADREGAAH